MEFLEILMGKKQMASDFSRQRLEEDFHLQTSMHHLIHQFLSRGLTEVGQRLPEKQINKIQNKYKTKLNKFKTNS